MTRRLYLDDPYVTSFEARIAASRETEHGPALVFEETYFYPESGGQPDDRGTIGDATVVRVLEDSDGTILHVVDRLPDGPEVHCVIDAARRRDHMQQHAGQHILSAAFVQAAGAQTLSFHLGANSSTIDLDKPVREEDVARAESLANGVIRRAAPIGATLTTPERAGEMGLRKPPPEPAFGEALRLVEVEGFDRQACCGTHPASAAEIGLVVVRGVERVKKATRVEFLCGDRALRDYHESTSRIRRLARLLSAREDELVDTAERFVEERKANAKELAKLRSAALASEVESWMDSAETVEGVSVLVRRAVALPPAELRVAARALVERDGRIVLLGSEDDGRAHLVFARSEDVDADMGALLRSAAAKVDGKGGGAPEIAQGGGPQTEGLQEALDAARASLKAERKSEDA